MAYTVVPVTDATFEEAVRLRCTAFEEAPLATIIRPHGTTPELLQHVVRKMRRSFNKPNHHFLAINDPQSGRIIAFSHWEKVNAESRAAPEDPAIEEPDSLVNRECKEVFWATIKTAQQEIMGDRDYWTLNILATTKEARGKGLGSALLNWGVGRADADGLECYLDSTPPGKSLYEKSGFVVDRILELDLNRWGKDWISKTYPMVRAPRTQA